MQSQTSETGPCSCFSTEQALKQWLRTRDKTKRYLFYGRSDKPLTYVAAWNVMKKTLERVGLSDKGYSLHHLRHTFATEMINNGMRIEVLQQILGHQNIEITFCVMQDPQTSA